MTNPSTDRVINVKILKVTRRDGSTIRAFVDVQIGGSLRLLGCKVIQQAEQKAWVAMPSREWIGDDGKKKYAPIVELSGSLKDAVEKAVLMAWEGGAR